MDEDKLKTIVAEVVDQAVKTLQEDLNGVKQDLKGVKEEQAGFKKTIDIVTKDLVEVKNTIETRVLPPLIYVETTVKSYADRYVTNEDHIGRLQKRVATVEDRLGIRPPQELTIPSID